jgi:hypothetical protein
MGEQVRLAVGRWLDVWRLWQDGMGGWTGRSGGMWWPDGKERGGQDRADGRGQTGGGGGARQDFVGAGRDGRVSEWEGCRGRQGRVSE